MALEGSSGAASGTNFGEQVSGTTLGNGRVFWSNYGIQLCTEYLSLTPLGISFWGAVLGNYFGK